MEPRSRSQSHRTESTQMPRMSRGQDMHDQLHYHERGTVKRGSFLSAVLGLRASWQEFVSGTEGFGFGCNRRREPLPWPFSYPSITDFKMPNQVDYLLSLPPASPECQKKHAWNPEDCSPSIFLLSDGLTFDKPVTWSSDCIRGRVGFTKGLHIWEIHWLTFRRGLIGVATKDAPLQYIGERINQRCDHIWGWDISLNKLIHGPNNVYSEPYTSLKPYDDLIGPDKFLVVLDMDEGTLAFIVDGHYLGVAFYGLHGLKLYPIALATCFSCQVSMRYIGGLEPGLQSLKSLARCIIRKRMGKHQLEEKISQLNVPHTLKEYLLYKD